MSRFRRWAGRLTGTHIFRRLPRGIALERDLTEARPGWSPDIVVDVGANVGQSALAFLAWFPRATVHCIEPAADSFATLTQRLAPPIAARRVRCHRLALSREAGAGRLDTAAAPGMRRLVALGTGAAEPVVVDTLDRWAEREGISRIGFLKVDTEGSDLAVLEGAAGLLRRGAVEMVQVEAGMNPENDHHAPFEALKAHLEARGFRLFGVYDQVGEWPTGQPQLRRANLVFLAGVPAISSGLVTVVPYRPEYAPDFVRLNRAWLERYFTVEPLDAEYLDDPEGRILAPGGEIFFAVAAGRVLGTCSAIPQEGGCIELAKLAVTPEAQGRGLGRALAEAVIAFARGRGARQVTLCSNSRLVPALRLYQSLGFVQRPFPGSPPYVDADVYMELSL